MDHARLLSPLTIGAITVKNRIVMPAFNLSYTPDGRIDERVIAFYEARAEGGAGMLVVGGCAVQAVGRGRNMIGVYDDGFSEGLSRLTARLKARGATVICQLFHGGAYAKGADGDSVAPSAVYSNYSKQTPRALSAGEVDAVLRDFASAAFRAKEAGFDGVELIGSAGYLLSQFLSPLKNKRDDAYAWQEKESPFAEALIRGIKARCGSEYPVVVRISGNEFVEGGRGSAGAIAAARVSEAAGADALSVTGGWHESRVPQITAHLPEAGYAYLAREVKQAVRLPIFAANRIDDPYVAEDLLASGSADAVCVGRGLIADPAFPRKVRDGASKLIRPCIACNQNCMDRVFSGAGLGCALNADAGRESVAGRSRKQDASAPARGKRVRVVGGGIAGCEAAIRLAESGCRVRLSEQADVLGGHLRTASAWDTGSLFKKFLAYQEHMLRRLCVDVETGRSVTGGELRDAREDLIVIATGSVVAPFGPEAKVFEGRALPATDAWAEGFIPGKDIVIIGGGALGVETAVMLARRSAASPELIRFLTLHDAESPERISELARRCGGRRITVVERSGRIGTGIGNSTRWIAMKLLRLYGVRLLADTTGFRFTPQGVEAETRDGVLMLEADTILAAAGFRSVLPRGPAVGGDPRRTVVIGDADRPGGIGKAIAQAAAVARGFVENA